MPVNKKQFALRHETPDDEEGFTARKSEIVINPGMNSEATVGGFRRGKGKRSLEEMMASMAGSVAQSSYALERIASFEDQIAKVLSLASDDALMLILRDRPTLSRYVTDEGRLERLGLED